MLLLIADDLGNDCGCYGNDHIKTPNIDALAKNGVRFTHGFAAVSSCSPSRASIYTGLHTHTSGQYGLQHAEHHFQTFDDVKSLPGLLNEAGWRTGIIGKIHVGPQSVYPFGVEVTKDIGGNRSVKAMAWTKAKQFFADADDKPFFLVMGYSDPHRSAHNFGNEVSYPGVTETHYDPKDVLFPISYPDQIEARLAATWPTTVPSPSDRLDEGVGMVLAALLKKARKKPTTILSSSSSATTASPSPARRRRSTTPGLRLPLIVSSRRTCRRSAWPRQQREHGELGGRDADPPRLGRRQAPGRPGGDDGSLVPADFLGEEKRLIRKGWENASTARISAMR